MSTPFSWQNRVDAAVAATELTRGPFHGHPKITVHFRTAAHDIIRDAAAARGVTVAGFARRASLAMAANVLGLAFEDALAADPTIQLPGLAPAADPNGRIGGPWEIVALK